MARARKKKPFLLRQCLFVIGILLIVVVTPLVGPIPGPGGVFTFGAGLALVLQNSEWAKRLYVRFKRRHPNKGRWADWGMRRTSARRREERLKQAQPEESSEPASPPASELAHPRHRRPKRVPLPEGQRPVRERKWWQ
jgi:hypothetical protein